jgi:uncharacterized protein YfaS (alpha-2-macroglobulin family)
MPKFISVGDEATGRLQIDFDGAAKKGDYTITLENRTKSDLVDRKRFTFDFNGGKAARFSTPFTLRAPLLEDLNLTVRVEQDGAVVAEKQWELGVRSRYPEVSVRKIGLLDGYINSLRLCLVKMLWHEFMINVSLELPVFGYSGNSLKNCHFLQIMITY